MADVVAGGTGGVKRAGEAATGTRSEPGREGGGRGRVEETRKPGGRELVVRGEENEGGQAKELAGEEQQ